MGESFTDVCSVADQFARTVAEEIARRNLQEAGTNLNVAPCATASGSEVGHQRNNLFTLKKIDAQTAVRTFSVRSFAGRKYVGQNIINRINDDRKWGSFLGPQLSVFVIMPSLGLHG